MASGGHSSSRCAGLSLSRSLLLRSTGSRRASSVVAAHGPSRSAACGILPDQGSNPCFLHWQADSQPLRHQGSPKNVFFNWAHNLSPIFLSRGTQVPRGHFHAKRHLDLPCHEEQRGGFLGFGQHISEVKSHISQCQYANRGRRKARACKRNSWTAWGEYKMCTIIFSLLQCKWLAKETLWTC